jgi:Tfp pilus assembly protein PilF
VAYINLKPAYLALLGVLFLVGCMGGGGKTKDSSIDDIEYQQDLSAPLVLIPNPYDKQKVNVPANVSASFNKALSLMEAKKWVEAEMVLEPLTQSNPNLSGPWLNMAICIWRQGETATASQAFDKALAANALNNDTYNAYAIFAREQGDFAKAESLYKKALQVWPHSAVSHRNLGVLYDMYMGRFDDALYHLEMSAKIMGEPDKELKGWIIDIKRRQKSESKNTQGPT